MTERSLILSALEVRAALDGRLKQIRRPMWPQPRRRVVRFDPCSVGSPGDRLWARETWQPLWADADRRPPTLKSPKGWAISYPATAGVVEYRDEDDGLVARCRSATQMPRWASRLSFKVTDVHVERVRAISIADVIACGVQIPVSDKDAPRGKVWPLVRITGKCPPLFYLPKDAEEIDYYRAEFASAWDERFAKRAPWKSDPWCWVVDIKRVVARAKRRAA